MLQLSQQMVRELFVYNPKTGLFINRKSRGAAKKGSISGTVNTLGYVQIQIAGKLQYAHRLAFLYMTGRWPDQIDHIDRVRNNNAWSNLRESTQAENTLNTSLRSDNKTGVKGVIFDKSRNLWRAEIAVNGVTKYLGRFPTKESAEVAVTSARLELHGEFYCAGT